MTQVLSVPAAQKQFDALVRRVSSDKDRVIIERGGVPVALLVPARGLRTLKDERARQFKLIDRIREGFSDQTADEIEAAVATTVAQVRSEARAKKGGAPRVV